MVRDQAVCDAFEGRGQYGKLAAVVASFVRGLPGDGCKGALEESVVHYVALVVFTFDDPVAGKDFALAGIGEDDGGMRALCRSYQKGSAGTEGFQFSAPCGSTQPTMYISLLSS